MDEHKLAELFRDAVRDAPPPSFDEGDIRSVSRQVTARRRSALALGSTMVVVLVFGGIVVGASLFGGGAESTGEKAAAGSIVADANAPQMTPFGLTPGIALPDGSATQRGGPLPKSIPVDPSTQGDESSGIASPSAGSTPSGCGSVDWELAVALAGELPVAEGTQPSPVGGTCPSRSRGAGYLVRDGGVVGVFSVVVVPKPAEGEVRSTEFGGPNARGAVKTAKSGATVHVVSEPEQGSSIAPFADRVDSVATKLADKY